MKKILRLLLIIILAPLWLFILILCLISDSLAITRGAYFYCDNTETFLRFLFKP